MGKRTGKARAAFIFRPLNKVFIHARERFRRMSGFAAKIYPDKQKIDVSFIF